MDLRKPLQNLFSFPVFLGFILAGCTYFLTLRGVSDPDIWWHLRNAEYLVNTHHFIRADMYSYTVPGTPWMNHEWLAEIPYYLAWRSWGVQGIFAVMTILIEAIVLGIYFLGYLVSGNSKAAFLATWLAMLLATVSFGPRMLLFGWAYLLALIAVLWTLKNRGRDLLWCLPPLFLLWINSHGSWLLGLIVFATFIATGCIEGTWGVIDAQRWRPDVLRKLLLVFALCCVAMLINPYGYKLVLYPFNLAFAQKLNISSVAEWASPNFHELRGKLLLTAVLITLIAGMLRKTLWKLEELALFLFAVYMSVTYVRFLFLAGIIFSPLLARRLDVVPPYRRQDDKYAVNAGFMLAVILFIVFQFPSRQRLEGDIAKDYPAKALPHLQTLVANKPGPVLNDYLWGGYLIWNERDVPVYVDSRVDIFEYKGVIKDYLDFISLKNSAEVLDKYHIQYVFIQQDAPVAYFLRHDPDWQNVYNDEVSVMFERKVTK